MGHLQAKYIGRTFVLKGRKKPFILRRFAYQGLRSAARTEVVVIKNRGGVVGDGEEYLHCIRQNLAGGIQTCAYPELTKSMSFLSPTCS